MPNKLLLIISWKREISINVTIQNDKEVALEGDNRDIALQVSQERWMPEGIRAVVAIGNSELSHDRSAERAKAIVNGTLGRTKYDICQQCVGLDGSSTEKASSIIGL